MKDTRHQRTLGASGISINGIGLGLMSLSGVYGASEDQNGINVIHRAIELGANFLDSAEMYGWGHNETLAAKALQGKRDQIVLVSKFGQVRRDDGSQGVTSPRVCARCLEEPEAPADRRHRPLLCPPHRP
ncbi:MAG: aldo/keto reductase [Burkholderiaceae bacterium]